MELIVFLKLHVWDPIWLSLVALYGDVLKPFGDGVLLWIQTYFPWCKDFADFVTVLFKLRYQGRIYGIMLLVPIIAFLFLISFMRSRIRKVRRCRRYAKKNRRA